MNNIFKPEVTQDWLPTENREAKQKYYQERYGDELTLAIKAARKNMRRRLWKQAR